MLDKSLGNILLDNTSLTEAQLEEGLLVQREKGIKLGEALIQLRFLRSEDILKAVSIQLGIPYLNKINPDEIPTETVGAVPINFAKKNELIPLGRNHDFVEVAIADPVNLAALDDLRMLYGVGVRPYIASSSQITEAINSVYNRSSGADRTVMSDLQEENLENINQELEEPVDLLESDDEAPIIRLVNNLVFRAVKQKASDIHVEPFERDLVVRFRIDGVLYDIMHPPKKAQNSVISRIKIMANLNIAEKRLPQDGRIRIKVAGKDIDIRVSTLPTSFGESVVMRLLDKSKVLLDLGAIGVQGNALDQMMDLINRSHGIILVTGPTGSGKTTTLYAMLSQINTTDLKIITVEDPVEYQLPGINQIQVNPKIDLTFAGALRSILRQDPDVVMIGEIRDKETAEIAIQASLTGHLVISTLHTNDTASSATRLIDMGVEPFLVASSVTGIIAQRLVRTLCKECRERHAPSDFELMQLGVKRENIQSRSIYRAKGCSACLDTGYAGRDGVHEIMMMDDEVRSLIMKNVDAPRLKRTAMGKGMKTLREVAADKVLQGLTTIEEVLRVTQEDVARE
ncbi:MAG TPA: type II secretion system protein GspE [Deltaproteobacteria bacterium]|nr:type II secretion system protein GspE [Deltaproteobacteria bacterium]